ncbi:MAG TPA: glutaredoxin family protein [Vicinamibacterales bacterium]
MKEFLSRGGYTFTVRNVEEDDAAYEALMALGIRAVPVTVIDGEAITGFNEAALRARLAAGS